MILIKMKKIKKKKKKKKINMIKKIKFTDSNSLEKAKREVAKYIGG